MEKQCSKCGVVKPFADFHKCKDNNDGLQTSCKNCKHEYFKANREKIAERNRKYREANPEKIAEYGRKYQEANREKLAEYGRKYREANPEKIAINSCREYLKNKYFDGDQPPETLVEAAAFVRLIKRETRGK